MIAGNDKKNKKNIYLIIFLILLTLLMLIFIIFSFFDFSEIIDKKEIYAEVIIGERPGVAKNNSALIFGMIRPNSISSKEINLVNNYQEKVLVEIVKNGNISEMIYVTENTFILDKDESRNIVFSVIPTNNTEFGTYNGQVYIIIKRDK